VQKFFNKIKFNAAKCSALGLFGFILQQIALQTPTTTRTTTITVSSFQQQPQMQMSYKCFAMHA